MQLVSRLTLATVVIAGALSAQRTWIVDPSGKGDFRKIQGAVDAAKHGDTVVVRAADYQEVPSVSKGLYLFAEGKVTVSGMQITNLAADKTTVVKGFTSSLFGTGIVLRNNRGLVHLVDIDASTTYLSWVPQPALLIDSCDLVTVTGGRFDGFRGALVLKSVAYFTNATLVGTQGYCSFALCVQAAPALSAQEGRVVISGGSCTGGYGAITVMVPTQPAPGIKARLSDIVLTGDPGTHVAAGGVAPGNTNSTPAITLSSSRLTIDPVVAVVPTNTTTKISGGTVTTRAVPALLSSTLSGRRVQLDLFTKPGAVAGLLVGLPARPLPVVPLGVLWVDPNQPWLLLDVGSVDAAGKRTTVVPFPAYLRRGQPVAFQSLTLAPGSGLELSTPTSTVIDP